MKKLTAALIALAALAPQANADTYNFSCKVGEKAYPLRVDDTKNTLEWLGRKYTLTAQEDKCANYGWRAEGNGTSFYFCGATKGYGAIQEENGQISVECDMRDLSNVSAPDPATGNELRIRPYFYNTGHYDLVISSNKDVITITSIQVNRGNCRFRGPRLPQRVPFGKDIRIGTFHPAGCTPIELKIGTDRGELVFDTKG